MSAKKTGLGRGFSALIPTELLDESFDPTAGQDEKVSDLRHVLVSEIFADTQQPRKHFDEAALAELAQSVREHGIVQPIVVTPRKPEGFTVVAGERRWRAAKLAGLEKIPTLVRTLSAQHKLELSLIENLQREDLNAMETATAYLKLRDQFNLTMEEIGSRVGGKSASAITNTLRLLRLPDQVKVAIASGQLTEGQARPLINLDREKTLDLLPKIIKEGWSARRVEAEVTYLKKQSEVAVATKTVKAEHRFEREATRLHEHLLVPVKIRASQRGSGTIAISFRNKNELDNLLKKLGG